MLDVLVALMEFAAAIVVAGAAVYGVNAWRREHVGRKRIDTAEKVLEQFYYARDALNHIRSPLGFGGEGRTRKRAEKETPAQSEILDRAFVPIERYNVHAERFAELRSLRYRAEAYWGKDATMPFATFENIVARVMAAAHALARDWQHDDPSLNPRREKRQREMEARIWSGDEDDRLSGLTETMVTEAEEICRPIIER